MKYVLSLSILLLLTVSSFAQCGKASFYSSGTRTASGRRFNPFGLTAAHRKLPFGTRIHVVNQRTGRAVEVTINDRGPFVRGRVLDLSLGAARIIGISGVGEVCF